MTSATPHASGRPTPPPSAGPVSASRALRAIARQHPWSITAAFSLVAAENILLVIYPLFAGFAIDAILQGQWWQACSYAGIVLLFWLLGALRRAVDTRVYTGIYAGVAVPVITQQRRLQAQPSTIVARVVLAREFVDFFEQHIPVLATSLISIIGAALMLALIEFWLGMACLGVLLIFALLLPGFSRTNQRLHQRLNDRLEQEVARITVASPRQLGRHYQALRLLRIAISDREALAYLAIGISAALLFLLAIMMLLQNPERSAGHVYAVMTYLWNFVSSLDEGPGLADQLAKLRDIGQRVDTTPADEAGH